MHQRPPRRVVALAAVVAAVVAVLVVTAAVLGGLSWWRDAHRSDLEQATSYAPGDAQRLSFTDWAAVRAKVGARLDASSSDRAVQDFLDEAYDDDLTSASALVQSASVLQSRFGFSPATVDWELFSQADDGAVVVLRVPDGTDFHALGDRLDRLGYTRPGSEDGVWEGGPEALAGIAGTTTPELQYVALDPDDHLVLTSDRGSYLGGVVDGLGDEQLPDGVRDVVAASGDPLSAAVYDGPYACSALAMSHADDAEQRAGEQLVAEAGEVNPLTGFAMGVLPRGDVRVALGFEDDDQARTNADTRAKLAGGPAPGQGGDFTDRYTLGPVTADGRIVTLTLHPREGSYVFSDLSTGPLLFATC